MSNRERWITRHLRRLWFGQFLQRAGEWLAGFLIAFGMVVLLTKRLMPDVWPHVLWLAVGSVPVAGLAWWLSRRDAFTSRDSVALLDRSLRADGLLMTLTEVPAEEWDQRLPQLEAAWRDSLPRLRPRRFATYIALPLAFAIGVCFIPLRKIISSDVPPPVTAGQQATQRLEQLLAAVQKAEVLEEQEEDQLTEEIRKLVEETRRTPLTHEKWETVDALEQQLRMQLNKAQLQSDKLMAAANLLAMAAAGEGPELTEEQLEQLEDELLETLMKKDDQKSGSAESGAMSDGLTDLLQRLTKGGTQAARLPSDPVERQKLLDELREHLNLEQQQLAELRKQCQGEEGENGKCAQCGGLCENGQQLCGQCAGDIAGGQQPGQGGVSRGRGDAELTWGDESNEQGVRFKESVLPPGYLEDPKDEVVGVRLTAPKVEPAATAARGAARDSQVTTGSETWERKLRPRHKQVVQQFFDSK
ncbi:MAG: hypothetical protein ACK5Q5_19460 [Planctomycetaceae bacterium]